MSGRRNLEVTWGILPPTYVPPDGDVGVGWCRVAGVRGDKLHLTPFATWATTAICGAPASDPSSFSSGHLCRKCADVAGVRSTDDLARDTPEYEWSQAQRDGVPNATVVHESQIEPTPQTPPAAVDDDPSSPAEIEPQTQPEPAEAAPSVGQLVDRLTASIEAARAAQRALRRAEADLLDARTALGRLS